MPTFLLSTPESSISSANAPSKPKDQSTPIRSPPELSRSPPQPSPMVTGSTPSKTRDIEVSVATSNGQVAQSPVPVATAQATGGMSLDASTMLGKKDVWRAHRRRVHLAREREGVGPRTWPMERGRVYAGIHCGLGSNMLAWAELKCECSVSVHTLCTDKDLIASASAFTKTAYSAKKER